MSELNKIKGKILLLDTFKEYKYASFLVDVVLGRTGLSSSGFPYIVDTSYVQFRDYVPHLYKDGQEVINFLNTIEANLKSLDCSAEVLQSIKRAVKVIRTVVYTAGVTVIPDLWLLRQVLGAHKELETLSWLLDGNSIKVASYAKKNSMNAAQLSTDLHFLYSRGYLVESAGGFVMKRSPLVLDVLKQMEEIPFQFKINVVNKMADWFSGGGIGKNDEGFIKSYLRIKPSSKSLDNWMADSFQLELGYRLLPLVLGLRVTGLSAKLRKGASITEHVPMLLPEMTKVFTETGITEGNTVTELGARVFERGPGPFGIIAAYYPYMNKLKELLGAGNAEVWVRRGANVAASQDANAKTFKVGNDSLNRFREEYDFNFEVFIEHAVGQGEATRQRYLIDGEKSIQYIGADLEDAAIDKAMEQQEMELLPQNMKFIRGADIGKPKRLIEFLQKNGLMNKPSVMMVGNGFHEIRQQTNEKMVEVFREYHDADLVLIFTEESALNDEDLLNTAWNTYHAGFRYVHEISGQGLRPAIDRGHKSALWSWRKCIRESGYQLLEEYSYRSRSIYPFKSSRKENPSISVTYFCVPENVLKGLGIQST